MKPLHLAEDTLPLGKFKTHASEVVRQLRSSQRPVVITQNGRPAAVLITPETFELHYRERFLASVRQGLADIEAGRVYEDDEVKRLLEEEFGSLGEE